MGYGYVFVREAQERVLASIDRYMEEKGLAPIAMTPEEHPRRMREFPETSLRLLWVSPQIRSWTGLHEFRFYNNEVRERWGYADENLALRLSEDLAVPVWRLEVIEAAGFWLYNRFEQGEEREGKAYEDRSFGRSADPDHPRYELNRIVDREGFPNIGLSYENIPGPMVAPVGDCRFWDSGIEGLDGFVHRAYRRT